jgi:hypothetical protein
MVDEIPKGAMGSRPDLREVRRSVLPWLGTGDKADKATGVVHSRSLTFQDNHNVPQKKHGGIRDWKRHYVR